MDEIIKKISAYNLFNYLFPGALFATLISITTKFSITGLDFISGFVLYYFFGLVISRFGSVVIEPILKSSKLIKFADYKDYIDASSNDDKLELLSQNNNMFRTLMSMLILITIIKLYEIVDANSIFIKGWGIFVLIFLLILLFIFSYRKQTSFIRTRVERFCSKTHEKGREK